MYFYSMRWANSKIGFDDKWMMLIGIPLFTFLIPLTFFGKEVGQSSKESWISSGITLLITSAIWFSSRAIMIWARYRYPSLSMIKKRLVVQTILIFLCAVLINNLMAPVFKRVCMSLLDAGIHHNDTRFASNAATIFCTLLVCSVYEVIYFMNELRKSVEEKEMLKRESLQAQLEALKTQVNPHFLFNNLNTLSAVIPDNPGQAIDFVQQLSRVYRHILEVKNEQSILLKEELEVLQAYAFLLKTRFGDNLDISIRVAEEKLQQKIIPLSLQILMENAIKHNIVSAAKPLRIDVYTENGRLIVSNNLQKKNQTSESTGIGLDNIRNRYLLLGSRPIEVEEGPSSFTVSIPLMGN